MKTTQAWEEILLLKNALKVEFLEIHGIHKMCQEMGQQLWFAIESKERKKNSISGKDHTCHTERVASLLLVGYIL